MLGLAAVLFLKNQQPQIFQSETPPEESLQDSRMEVHYLDVGQGDATLIVCDGEAMLIDAGDNSKGTQIQLYLMKQGIEQLKYVIGTHPDADHIGGLDVILYKFDCAQVFLPDMEKDTQSYEDVIQTLKYKGYEAEQPPVGETFSLGGASFTVIAPNDIYADSANDSSIGILLAHGANRFLFTGDAEKLSETDMLKNGIDLSADVYKVSHHGSSSASSEAFLDAVSPDYAVISCGKDNPYGHPHQEVLGLLQERGIEIFRTDQQGTIVMFSDGETLRTELADQEAGADGRKGIILNGED